MEPNEVYAILLEGMGKETRTLGEVYRSFLDLDLAAIWAAFGVCDRGAPLSEAEKKQATLEAILNGRSL